MKIFYAFAPVRYFARLTLLALIILPGFMACSTYHAHHKEWIGVFMFDSVTAGAVLLEYDESSPKGNTMGNGDQYNVDVDLFRYDFAKQTLTKGLRNSIRPICCKGRPMGKKRLYSIWKPGKKGIGNKGKSFKSTQTILLTIL